VCVRACACMYVSECVHVGACVCVCVHVCMYVHIFVCACMCACGCMCAFMCTCACHRSDHFVFMPTRMPKRQQDKNSRQQEHCEILSCGAWKFSHDLYKLFDTYLFIELENFKRNVMFCQERKSSTKITTTTYMFS